MAEAERTDAGGERPRPGEVQPPQRFGPLAVERLRKADGRLLILYKRVGEDG